MSLLNNNTKALAMVSGMSAEELAEILGPRQAVSGTVTAAVWNTDTERRKEKLLSENPAGVVAGLKALAVLSGAKGAVIVSPMEGVEDALLAAAKQADLPLCLEKKADLVKFDHRDDLLVPLDEAAAVAARLCGDAPGILIAVDDGELRELPGETKVAELLPAGIKAVLTDHRFYAPHELEGLSLASLGSKSGVLRVLTDQDCLVDQAKKEVLALRQKSCGRCTFCREGLFQLSAILQDLSTGRLKPQALDLAGELTEAMRVSTSCSLGEDAACPAASLLRAFPQEVEAHARRKECPAGVCAAFTTFYIDPNRCVGSRDCVKVCPARAIEARPGFTSVIESFDCTRCGACLTVCAQNAIVKVSGKARIPDKPARLKNAPVEEAPVETAAPARESAGKRKRSFARPAGAAAPAAPGKPAENAPALTPEPMPVPIPEPKPVPTPEPAPAPAPARPAAQSAAESSRSGKRKRTFAKPIKPE